MAGEEQGASGRLGVVTTVLDPSAAINSAQHTRPRYNFAFGNCGISNNKPRLISGLVEPSPGYPGSSMQYLTAFGTSTLSWKS